MSGKKEKAARRAARVQEERARERATPAGQAFAREMEELERAVYEPRRKPSTGLMLGLAAIAAGES